jgi:hypothetical protein
MATTEYPLYPQTPGQRRRSPQVGVNGEQLDPAASPLTTATPSLDYGTQAQTPSLRDALVTNSLPQAAPTPGAAALTSEPNPWDNSSPTPTPAPTVTAPVATAGQPTSNTRTRGTSPYLAEIRALMKQAYGREPTEAEVNGWGNDIDPYYFARIKQAILNSPEAKAFAARGATPPATTTPSTNRNWAAEDYRDTNNIRAYFVSRGLTGDVLERVVNTWAQYRAMPWAEDTEYFFRRMAAEEALGGGGGGGYADAPNSPFTDEIRKILLDRIAKNSGPFDPDSDPGIKAAMSGATLTSNREMEALRHELAEQNYASGALTSSVPGQQTQQSRERAATGLGTLKGNLVMKEIDARRTDLTNLLQMAIASGDADLARKTQIALANLQAMLTREGFGWDWKRFEANTNAGIGSN